MFLSRPASLEYVKQTITGYFGFASLEFGGSFLVAREMIRLTAWTGVERCWKTLAFSGMAK